MRAADGRTVHVLERDAVVRDEAGRPAYSQGVVLDVTALREAEAALRAEVADRRRAEEQIAYLAYHDALTGLPNRALLAEHLELALARARRHGTRRRAPVLDLDDFKLVNDSLGHAAGDELLCQVAARLHGPPPRGRPAGPSGRRRVPAAARRRRPDDPELVARGPRRRACSRRSRRPFVDRRRPSSTSARSIGISVSPRDAHDADDAPAPRRRRDVPGQGRRPRRRPRSRRATAPSRCERLSIASRLRRAVERDELVLHFQPIVDPRDGALCTAGGARALGGPERGLVPPGDFIPLAEETGLIDARRRLGRSRPPARRRAWRAAGLEPQIARQRLAARAAPRRLRRAPARAPGRATASTAGRFTVELTETDGDGATTARVEPSSCAELAAAGVQLAIDDFGDGLLVAEPAARPAGPAC